MTDEQRQRRLSDWERDERLVLQSLQDLRLSSDATLKAQGEMRETLIAMVEHGKHQDERIEELQGHLARQSQWLMGILAAMIIFGLQWAFNTLQAALPVALK